MAVIVEVRGRPFVIASIRRAPQVAAAILVVAAFATTAGYIRHSRKLLPLWPNYTARVEYRVTDWLWKNMPDARANPSGSVRFWFDAWHDLAQLGGGSEQGLLNPVPQEAQWEISGGSNSTSRHSLVAGLGSGCDVRGRSEFGRARTRTSTIPRDSPA